MSSDVRIFHKECASLAKAGYEVYLVAKGDSREEKGVHIVGVGEAPSNRIKRMLGFSRRVYSKALELDADIYHIHDPELLPYGLKLKKLGKKVIFDSHENYPAQISEKKYLPVWARKTISFLFRAYETYVVKQIDAVVVPCTFDGINIFDGRCNKSVIVANHPILGDFYDAYNPLIEKKYAVCYCGGLTYQRGIYHLIKAVDASGRKLLLAGNFSDKEFEKNVRLMDEFSCVEYAGNIPNSEIANLIQSCHIGANTILNIGQYHHLDTFGVKVYEYMSVGLPVLMPDYPFAREKVEQYKFGICVDPENIEEVSAAIRKILSSPEEARRMGLNGRKAVEQEFNWSTQEKVLLELYAGL